MALKKSFSILSLYLFLSFVVVPSVLSLDAGSVSFDPSNFIGSIGEIVWNWMQNDFVVYLFTFIFFFVLLYGIYAAALTRVEIFKGGGGLNKQGKMVAVAFSALSCFGIFYFTESVGIEAVLRQTLSSFGILGGLVIALLTFMIIFFGFRQEAGGDAWKMALAAAGLAMVCFGLLTTRDSIMWWGWLAVLIGVIAYVIGMFGRGGNGGGNGNNDDPHDPPPPRPPIPPVPPVQAPQQVQNFRGEMHP